VDDVVLVGGAESPFAGSATFTALGFPPNPNALVLYGVNSGDDGLSVINPATGAASFINRLSPDLNLMTTPVAMASRPSDGALFVWNNSDLDPNTQPPTQLGGYLVRVDVCTGRGTRINPDGPRHDGSIGSLAFSPEGTLYALQISNPRRLFTVNTSTGALTAGPDLTLGGAPFSAFGADFGPDGRLYAVSPSGELATINVTTGVATLIGTLNPSTTLPQTIAFDPSGGLIGAASSGQLFDINITTAVISNLRSTSRDPQGMDFGPACIE
jgi:WD40 repeat protein